MMAYLLGRLMAPFQAMFVPEERIFWMYLIAAMLIAGCAQGSFKRLRFIKMKLYFFSRHSSAWADYRFFIINRVLFGVLFSPFFLALNGWVASACEYYLQRSIWPFQGIAYLSLWGWDGFNDVAFSICSLIAMDGAFFISHRWMHQVPMFWSFHQVHHSAEVLTPMTAYRVHPVDDMLSISLSGLLGGIVEGCFNWMTGHHSHMMTLAGVHIGLLIFYLTGFNVRHSRAWISYGPFWSRWLMSPAQHHIHHSLNPGHFNKNFGFIFSIWDRLAGSLWVPIKPVRIRVGLDPLNGQIVKHSVLEFYFRPFRSMLQRPRSRIAAVLIMVLLGEIAWINASASYQALSAKSVFLEDLGSPEVKRLIANGYDTLLIPTGGIEQNGSHMALGKHNTVLRYTSEQIALQLGHTLVAPVIPIVPEGQFNPPGGHMQWAGTLSLSPEVFEDMLLNLVQSAQVHGFHFVCFIGEHGDSQSTQARVAKKVNQHQWVFSPSVFALNVDGYYRDEEQRAWLIAKGETEETIGHHAGIIDTSELMAIAPHLVWLNTHEPENTSLTVPLWSHSAKENRTPSHGLQVTGSDGLPHHASAQYGKMFLNLKIKHAVEQIQSWRLALTSFLPLK